MLGIHSEVEQSLPGREFQLETLSRVIGSGIVGHPLIFLSGPSGSGKTVTLSRVLPTTTTSATAWIHCIEAFTDSLVLESILDQLSGTEPSASNGFKTLARCDSLQVFVPLLNELLDSQDVASTAKPMHRFVVCITHVTNIPNTY
jgi:Cdc6-like AAA superfamily ATPase